MTTPTPHEKRRSPGAEDVDRGMTLPEVLISIVVLGLISGAIMMAIVTTYRTSASTEGRVNVARAEAAIDTWLPADLTSTDVSNANLPAGISAVNTDPAATPCAVSDCSTVDLSGANALQLSWVSKPAAGATVEDGYRLTQVQYQYLQVGTEWQLQRIICEQGQACRMHVVLHDLAEPPNLNDPTVPYDPNLHSPTWVLDVSTPSEEHDDAGEVLAYSGEAKTVQVIINGGGSSDGAGGGQNRINLTAGGVRTNPIDPDDFVTPSFVRARSRCGGNISVVIDDSGTIGSAVDDIEDGVIELLEEFKGTPTRFQLVQFSTYTQIIEPGESGVPSGFRTLGTWNSSLKTWTDPGAWHHYVDMTDEAAVDSLIAAVRPALDSDGGTNWEDALFRTFKNPDGTDADLFPDRIIMFTDGVPSSARPVYLTTPGVPIDYNDGVYSDNGWYYYSSSRIGTDWDMNGREFSQQSWDRADLILDQYTDLRSDAFTMVAMGPDLNDTVEWTHNPAAQTNRHTSPVGGTAQSSIYQPTGADVAARLLGNNGPGTTDSRAGIDEFNGSNGADANFYHITTFDKAQFVEAMKNSVLKDCGGSLTIQTRFPDGSAVDDEFVYENATYRDDTGTTVPNLEARRVTTSSRFRTGTFDFDTSASTAYYSVDIVPQELQTLDGYEFLGWSCRSGPRTKTITPIDIANSSFSGFTVDVSANEALSCIMEVGRP